MTSRSCSMAPENAAAFIVWWLVTQGHTGACAYPCQNARRGLILIPTTYRAMLALTSVLLLAACGRMTDAPKNSSLADRVGSTAFLQLETDSFTSLTPKQQAL